VVADHQQPQRGNNCSSPPSNAVGTGLGFGTGRGTSELWSSAPGSRAEEPLQSCAGAN
jgi:hypothetical protein